MGKNILFSVVFIPAQNTDIVQDEFAVDECTVHVPRLVHWKVVAGEGCDFTAHAHSTYSYSKHIVLQQSLVVQSIYMNSVAGLDARFVKENSIVFMPTSLPLDSLGTWTVHMYTTKKT
jgi:hypothetical protein